MGSLSLYSARLFSAATAGGQCARGRGGFQDACAAPAAGRLGWQGPPLPSGRINGAAEQATGGEMTWTGQQHLPTRVDKRVRLVLGLYRRLALGILGSIPAGVHSKAWRGDRCDCKPFKGSVCLAVLAPSKRGGTSAGACRLCSAAGRSAHARRSWRDRAPAGRSTHRSASPTICWICCSLRPPEDWIVMDCCLPVDCGVGRGAWVSGVVR